MLYYKEVEGKNGKTMKRYSLTQGDTFQNQLSITDSDGNVISADLISEVLFKLSVSGSSYEEEYTQEYTYDEGLQQWTIVIAAETTAEWAIDTHIYEYQITYANGLVSTPVQERFIVLKQIQS